MRSHHGSRFAALLLIVVLIAGLCSEAEAKKRSRKKKSKKKSSHSSWSRPSSPAVSSYSGDSVRIQQLQVHAEKQQAQLQELASKCNAQNSELVQKHNKIAAEYNNVLTEHNKLIQKYNSLVKELEDPSLAQALAAKAIKAYHHPGIEGAVNKTYIHVLPAATEVLAKGSIAGERWFNETQSKVQHFLESYGGEGSVEWASYLSGWIVYGFILIPLAISCWCVLEFVCKLNHLIVFGHCYLAVSGILMTAFTLHTGEDPLSTFAEQDPKLYQFAQCSFAIVFVFYGMISTVALCCVDDTDSFFRTLHFAAMLLFGVGYYILIWTPAMLDEGPRVDDFVESLVLPDTQAAGSNASGKEEDVPLLITVAPYVVISAVFSFLYLFETSSSKVRPDGDEEKGD